MEACSYIVEAKENDTSLGGYILAKGTKLEVFEIEEFNKAYETEINNEYYKVLVRFKISDNVKIDMKVSEFYLKQNFIRSSEDSSPGYTTTQKDFQQLTKKHNQDAGLDICSNEDITIGFKKSALISTGLFVEIPENHVGLVWPRSGLSVKSHIEVGAGCIDASYRGELKVHLYNFGDYPFNIKKGDRIAQLLTIPVNLTRYKIKDNISETDRGHGGFGSTGV